MSTYTPYLTPSELSYHPVAVRPGMTAHVPGTIDWWCGKCWINSCRIKMELGDKIKLPQDWEYDIYADRYLCGTCVKEIHPLSGLADDDHPQYQLKPEKEVPHREVCLVVSKDPGYFPSSARLSFVIKEKECPECKGAKEIQLFTSTVACSKCS